MQYFSKDEYVQQLPRCSGCLHDFDLYQYPVSFICKHIYCSQCLKRLKDKDNTYHCLYDGSLTPVANVREDIGFYNRIDYFRRFVMTRSEVSADVIKLFDQIKKEVNFDLVACRTQLDTGACSMHSRCPYDHSAKSLGAARIFRDSDLGSCWECRTCMLTVARRLAKCPVCGALQETQNTHKMLEDNLDRLEIMHEVRKPPNPIVDLAVEGRDAKVRPVVKEQEEASQSVESSREREEEAKSSTNPPEPAPKPKSKATSCCILH